LTASPARPADKAMAPCCVARLRSSGNRLATASAGSAPPRLPAPVSNGAVLAVGVLRGRAAAERATGRPADAARRAAARAGVG
jgi:hypothetical protein